MLEQLVWPVASEWVEPWQTFERPFCSPPLQNTSLRTAFEICLRVYVAACHTLLANDFHCFLRRTSLHFPLFSLLSFWTAFAWDVPNFSTSQRHHQVADHRGGKANNPYRLPPSPHRLGNISPETPFAIRQSPPFLGFHSSALRWPLFLEQSRGLYRPGRRFE